jgi:primosomal protein N' (replication factor Y)
MQLTEQTFAEIILPLPLADTYTYSIPSDYQNVIVVGMRVTVSLRKKIYTGIVCELHHRLPLDYEVKDILSVLDDFPIVRANQLAFWKWIAGYYQCYLGDVYKAALPSGLKLDSETRVRLQSDWEERVNSLSKQQEQALFVLSKEGELSVTELAKAVGIKEAYGFVKGLFEKELIQVSEALRISYKPKKEDYVRLNESLMGEGTLNATIDSLKKAKKQQELFLSFLDLSQAHLGSSPLEVRKKDLLDKAGMDNAILQSLVKKSILQVYQKEKSRLDLSEIETVERFPLNTFQQKAYEEIHSQFKTKQVILLHGVTSSGKTEIYIHLIEEALQQGKQVLYLLPEIALTSQLTTRLKRVFGNKLGVYHSKFPDAERVEIWDNLLRDKGYQIILGVRSSVFLPFKNLGLLIVDEEHENTYKQYDPAPRYHARNAAIVLASLHGAKTLLGTATPSIETYNNALSGKFGLVELLQRHEEIALPEIIAVDTKELRRKKQMRSFFSPLLLAKITDALEKKEQIILFQNRRGYAPYVECPNCGHVPVCKNCDVSLTFHKAFNALTCHYCGFTESIPPKCPCCEHPGFESKGFGTEKIEDEVQKIFPDARVARLDLDTTRTKTAYERIIEDFQDGKVDILIGTQMVSKGLDFEHVSLVGILNADNMLNYPDFRSHERAFQLMAQVSGRAGRKNKQGCVILQTSDPKHPVIQQVIANDYLALFRTQMQERHEFKYPPYFRLINILIKHREMDTANKASRRMADALRNVFGFRVLGPDNPPVNRIQNLFIKQIVLKIEAEASNEEAKKLIAEVSQQILSDERFKSVTINLDVDPM